MKNLMRAFCSFLSTHKRGMKHWSFSLTQEEVMTGLSLSALEHARGSVKMFFTETFMLPNVITVHDYTSIKLEQTKRNRKKKKSTWIVPNRTGLQ